MPRVNWPKNVIDAFWNVVLSEPELVDVFGGKWINRQMTLDEIIMERAPFLATWLTVPTPVWWAAKATKISVQTSVIGVVVTGDREDLEIPTMTFVNLAGALEDDLARTDGHSFLRDDALVYHFEYTNPAWVYGRQIDTDEGVYLIQCDMRFALKNPNC